MMRLEYGPTDKVLILEAATESELAEKLRPHICGECLDDAGLTDVHGSLREMLCTPCGCEWWYEEDK